MKIIEDEKNLDKKKILLRLDLNIPLQNGIITDSTRIDKILPTLHYLLKYDCKIIIISHIGRPKGKVDLKLSMKPVCDYLTSKLDQKIKFISKKIFEVDLNSLFLESNEKILFLENIRFYEGEEKNDKDFAKMLSKFGDIYINDAFSCSHRAHASVTKITEYLPSFCGLQMNQEISALKKITTEIEQPMTCIIGGSKISTKINIIKNLIPKFKNVIFVGGMANNILEYKGFGIGKSIKEKNCENIIENIFLLAKKNDCNIIFPTDVSVGKNIHDQAIHKELKEIDEDDLILDIGKNSIKNIKSIIDNSKTIFWNGPAGYFENQNFAEGSMAIAKKIASQRKNIYSVAGGGDTIALLNRAKVFDKLNFVSTAGGAFLEYLEGKEIPGIKSLK
ncbi:phosphoglycerate kinase [Candidatus Pelagibacter sp.]|nr:phosphoglycerate kinase [Candidatus Pelagibacter sp.]